MNLTSRLTVLAAATLTLAAAALTATTDAHAATATYSSTAPFAIGSNAETGEGLGVTAVDAPLVGVAASTPYGTPAYVTGAVGTITDVDVYVTSLQHDLLSDLDLMLVSPTGTAVMLLSDAGGTAVNAAIVSFDDEAAAPVGAGQLDSGNYQPTDIDGLLGEDVFPAPAPSATGVGHALSAFDGEVGIGTWRLYVVDDAHQDAGKIGGWGVQVRTSGQATYPSTIDVSGAPATADRVTVRFDGFEHSGVGDLDILLVAPSGRQVTLLSDVAEGWATAGAVQLTFDDAGGELTSTTVKSGTYRPQDRVQSQPDEYPAPAPTPDGNIALSTFAGSDPNGTWRLFVHDDTPSRSGRLGGWSLTFTSADSVPPVVVPTPADTVAPRVTSTRPAAGATRVRRAVAVVARMSEPVVPGTVTRGSAYLVAKGSTLHVRASVAYDAATGSVRIEPIKRLRAATRYRAVLTPDIADAAGNRLARTVWRFTTR